MVIKTTLLVLLLISEPCFGDQLLRDSISQFDKAFLQKPVLPDFTCIERSCPDALKNSVKDIYNGKKVGAINALFSDGSVKNARTACDSSVKNLHSLDLNKLNDQLSRTFPNTPQLFELTPSCFNQSFNKESRLAHSYMAYDFSIKSEALKKAMLKLIASNAQVNLILPNTAMNCSEIPIAEAVESCKESNDCQKGNKEFFLSVKTDETFQSLKAIQKLNAEIATTNLKFSALSADDRKKLKKLEDDVENIKDLNPLLRGKQFKQLLSKIKNPSFEPGKSELTKAVVAQLEESRGEATKKIKEFGHAYRCLTGDRVDCSEFSTVMKQIPIRHFNTYPGAKELNEIGTFYSCAESNKEYRDEAQVVLDEVAVNLALSMTPYAVVGVAKLATTVGGVSLRLARAEALVGKAAMGAGVGYGGFSSAQEFKQCQSEIQAFQKLGAEETKMSCQNMDQILINNSNNSQCVTQALISSALLLPVAGNSLRLAKLLPKSIIPIDTVKALASKIRSGQSLTQQESRILLNRLKEKNPLDKLLVKGISQQDKLFSTRTLEKLYQQQDVSPQDLLRLSKLIKEKNPPLLMITRQDNVDDILKSGRIWGSTEGSVYAASRPATTAFDKLKTGVHGDKEGTFIFTPEAAALFKPHEVTGIYSGLKRVAGQHKSPFGDVIIESFKKTVIDGKPYIIITKARRAGGKERLHQGQTTNTAALRLTGRRSIIDPVATGTAGLVSIQAASVYTGIEVSDILFEIFEETPK